MTIVTSGFYSRSLLLAISADPVKVLRFIAASLNIEFLFVDRQGSGARTRSTCTVGAQDKTRPTSYCSTAGIIICHI